MYRRQIPSLLGKLKSLNIAAVTSQTRAVGQQRTLVSHFKVAAKLQTNPLKCHQHLLTVRPALNYPIMQTRNRVTFSWRKAKAHTVKAVIKRFKRLDCGLWIRTRSGRRKRLWKKSSTAKRRARTHVVCNKRQSWLLDRMVSAYWKKPRHYPNDPYAPYHTRTGLDHIKIYKKKMFYP